MPYLSDADLQMQLQRVGSSDSAIERHEDSPLAIIPLCGGMSAAAVVGFLRSKFEDPATGEWNIHGTKWDAECCGFFTLAAVALLGQHVGLADYRSYAAVGAIGVGCHLAGEMGHRFGKTGHVFVGGAGTTPAWDSSHFEPTQYPGQDEASVPLTSAAA